MAVLILLDTAGPVACVGEQRIPVDVAGLEVIRLLGWGAQVGTQELADLAERHAADLGALDRLADQIVDLEVDGRMLAPPTPLLAAVPLAPRTRIAYDPDVLLQAQLPMPVLASGPAFLAWPAGEAEPVTLTAAQVDLLGRFALPARGSSIDVGLAGHPLLVDVAARDAALAELCAVGLLHTDTDVPYRTTWDKGAAANRRIHRRTRRLVAQQADQLAARPARAGRTPVLGVDRTVATAAPLALGMVLANAEAHDGGALAEQYDFVPDWHVRAPAIRRATADGPGVFLFSNYVWSSAGNLDLSEKVKAISPDSLVVHGGPHSPKYPGDRERYFADHPAVDVIVHGEGEATAAELLAVLAGDVVGRREALADVAGITYRPAPGAPPVTTEDRTRIATLDDLPSPYLTGWFDAWRGASVMAIIESNRGCPYGCTFCDWGSATLSRIRQFDLDRVKAELDWVAEAEVPIVMLADANFGIFERDVAIAQHLADLKARTGFPQRLVANYAKNTVKHIEPIVGILADAELDVNGVMSVQSFDEDVLRITKRKNLRADEFERIATRFRERQMPMLSDLMLGLPGATLETTRFDLQGVIEAEVNANVHPTHLLPNSPMNEPTYRADWQIVTDEDGVILSTRSYTVDDRAEMDRMVDAFHAADTYGILRVALRWLSARLDRREIDLLEELRAAAVAEPGRWPLTHHVLTSFLDDSTPPGPWSLLFDEVAALVDHSWGIAPDDPEWVAVRTLQVHVLPDRHRAFPDRLDLPFDVPAWLRDRADDRGDGRTTAPLASYPPVTVEISDPYETCATVGTRHSPNDHHSFELVWPGARHKVKRWSPD